MYREKIKKILHMRTNSEIEQDYLMNLTTKTWDQQFTGIQRCSSNLSTLDQSTLLCIAEEFKNTLIMADTFISIMRDKNMVKRYELLRAQIDIYFSDSLMLVGNREEIKRRTLNE